MYAIFGSGGRQYKVSAGDRVRLERIPGKVGDKVKIVEVIAVQNDSAIALGSKTNGAVNATIVAQDRAKKVTVFKFKAKKDYRRKAGHRQAFTEIFIDNIMLGNAIIDKAEIKQKKTEGIKTISSKNEAATKPAPKPVKTPKAVKEPKPVKAPKVVKEPEPVKPSKPVAPASGEQRINTGKPSDSPVDVSGVGAGIDRPLEKAETEKPPAKPATEKDIKENKDGK